MRASRIIASLIFIASFNNLHAQESIAIGEWSGKFIREDGNEIPFLFDIVNEQQKTILYLKNGKERIRVSNVKKTKDSIFIETPVFESYFKARIINSSKWEGVWTKAGSLKMLPMPFVAQKINPDQNKISVNPSQNISGKWAIVFENKDGKKSPAIGEWKQSGNLLVGSILTPTGDYRYLNGFVQGDSLTLSTFDGSHAFLIKGKIRDAKTISGGVFYSGSVNLDKWEAEKNEQAILPHNSDMYLKEGVQKIDFKFRNLDKKWVSLNDPAYQNKVVILQIMGSWCPNCMDETAFLSEFYRANKSKGVEVIALAYEYSTDFERSKKSIQKFKDRFQVKYEMLNTEVTVSDTLRTEKTLPQFTPIKSFPTMIILDKNKKLVKVHAGFEGPGTGEHYTIFKKEFGEIIDQLLKK